MSHDRSGSEGEDTDSVTGAQVGGSVKRQTRDGEAAHECHAASYYCGVIATPHGLPGDLTRAISFSVLRSTTETSSDGPFAE